jgi:hypothetical protein
METADNTSRDAVRPAAFLEEPDMDISKIGASHDGADTIRSAAGPGRTARSHNRTVIRCSRK